MTVRLVPADPHGAVARVAPAAVFVVTPKTGTKTTA